MSQRVPRLDLTSIQAMGERMHDLDFMVWVCEQIMVSKEMLPFPFSRAVILLSKQQRYSEALVLCDYVKWWCEQEEMIWDHHSAKVWLSPGLQKLIARRSKLAAKIDS